MCKFKIEQEYNYLRNSNALERVSGEILPVTPCHSLLCHHQKNCPLLFPLDLEMAFPLMKWLKSKKILKHWKGNFNSFTKKKKKYLLLCFNTWCSLTWITLVIWAGLFKESFQGSQTILLYSVLEVMLCHLCIWSAFFYLSDHLLPKCNYRHPFTDLHFVYDKHCSLILIATKSISYSSRKCVLFSSSHGSFWSKSSRLLNHKSWK